MKTNRFLIAATSLALTCFFACSKDEGPAGPGGSSSAKEGNNPDDSGSGTSPSPAVDSGDAHDAAEGKVPADCGQCTGCCSASGECTGGTRDDQCGAPGFLCQSCTAQGKVCRGLAGGFDCVQIKLVGQPCHENAECVNGNCGSSGTCEELCLSAGDSCWGNGGDRCCEANTTCDNSIAGAPPGQCCYVSGTKIEDHAKCMYCCSKDGAVGGCDVNGAGEWHCK